MSISGLPEGLELVKLGAPKEDEFSLVGERIIKGVIPNAASGVIVKPAEGYTFQPSQRFDIDKYEFIPGPPNEFMVVKVLQPVTIKVSAEYVVTSEFDQNLVSAALKRLNSLPGCVRVTVE